MPDDPRIDRRRFFRDGLRELLKPLAEATHPIERALKELEKMTGELPAPSAASARPGVMRTAWLRPPGAMSEREFRDMCSRCGICVSVCPAEAIKIDSTGLRGNGAPYIDPSESPCVACDGLHCMQNCPSGALSFVPLIEIDMGIAIWNENQCLRRSGEDCRLCVEQCPIGETAIVIDEWRVKVLDEGCIGCGVCEHACPTGPKSITIKPRSQRDSGTVSRS